MTAEVTSLRLAARRSAIERAEKEYKLQCDVYDTADRKAQATTTIAGALLAADLGFVAKLSETPSLFAQLTLVAITGALGCSVLLALWAMYARDTWLPATLLETEPEYLEVMKQGTPAEFGKAESELLDFLIEKLKEAITSVTDVSAVKARWVHRAQKALIVAALATIGLTLALIFRPDLLTLKSNAEPSAAQGTAVTTGVSALKDLHALSASSAVAASSASPILPSSLPAERTAH